MTSHVFKLIPGPDDTLVAKVARGDAETLAWLKEHAHDLRDMYRERLAIREVDAGLDPGTAAALAAEDVTKDAARLMREGGLQ